MTTGVTALLILAVTINTAASHALLKRGLAGAVTPSGAAEAARLILQCAHSPLVWCSLALQGLSYALWILVLSKERMAVAAALSGSSFYLLMAGIGWTLFNEQLSTSQIAGIVFITIGAILVSL